MIKLVWLAGWRLLCLVRLVCALAASAAAAPPTFDHVVIVIEENHSFDQVIGNPTAPYINSLADAGASFTNFYGITHPSQPNYLQLFSGSNQGVTSNSTPSGIPFTTANLGAELLAAGHTFTGFSQSMPSVGYSGSSFTTMAGQNQYERKHNPWANWQAASPGTNQLLPTTNRPFTDFPSDFSNLPRLSIVVPDEQNDMHDGSIAQGDTWLQSNLGSYAAWAQTHNSLLVVTFDEDNSSSGNRIPTIFSGASVRAGENASTWTLHNLLRTVEDMYSTSHAGSAADVRAISGVFTSDPVSSIRRFQQGSDGYLQTQDTYIESGAAGATHGGDSQIVVDGSPLSQGLVRFDDIIGDRADQIPKQSTIVSAKLALTTGAASGDVSADNFALHQMIMSWTEASTWTSLSGGVATDGNDAAIAPEFRLIPNVGGAPALFDVSDSLQSWLANPDSNQGWLIKTVSGSDGWRMAASEGGANQPALEVTYVAPFVLGDMDGDGDIDNFDIQPFELALTNQGTYLATYPGLQNFRQRGNANGDTAFDNSDIQFFEQLLTASSGAVLRDAAFTPVPEPSAFLLALGALPLVIIRMRRIDRRAVAG